MNMLYWREPLWLIMALYPLCLWLWGHRRQRRVWLACADAVLWPWLRVSQNASGISWARGLADFAWVCLCVALAGPRLPLDMPQHARPPAGALVAVLDLSRSMDVRDENGNRRDAVVRALRRWNQGSGTPSLAIVVFAGRAHLFFPAVTDPAVREHFLSQLPALPLPTLGNDVGGALAMAQTVLEGIQGDKTLALFSDGDWGGSALERALPLAAKLAGQGIDFKVFGVGGDSPSAVPDGNTGWLKEDGRPVVSRREKNALQQLAVSGGGEYYPLTTENIQQSLWRAMPHRITRQHRDAVLWRELYPWFLVPGLLSLAFFLLRVSFRLPAREIKA